jgi:hypothetical protein
LLKQNSYCIVSETIDDSFGEDSQVAVSLSFLLTFLDLNRSGRLQDTGSSCLSSWKGNSTKQITLGWFSIPDLSAVDGPCLRLVGQTGDPWYVYMA